MLLVSLALAGKGIKNPTHQYHLSCFPPVDHKTMADHHSQSPPYPRGCITVASLLMGRYSNMSANMAASASVAYVADGQVAFGRWDVG